MALGVPGAPGSRRFLARGTVATTERQAEPLFSGGASGSAGGGGREAAGSGYGRVRCVPKVSKEKKKVW